MTRLFLVLAVLLVLMALPLLVEKIHYASEFGKQRARVEAARAGLGDPGLKNLSTASRWVAQAVGPSVVQIQTRHLEKVSTKDEWHRFLGLPHREFRGEGSGVIVDAEGYILTNYHVVRGGEEVYVRLGEGREYVAQIVGYDEPTDLAVLKINAKSLIASSWGDSEALETGDMVWAVGSPFGLDHSVTFGIVSAKGRPSEFSHFQKFLQTDAAVNPGNSGGPLVNIQGHVVGINTAIVGPTYQGISFAIPSAIARGVYEGIKSDGKFARGWLGVQLGELTQELAEDLQLQEVRGVLIRGVVRESPAERGGIQPGDVILQWNEQPVNDQALLSRSVAATSVGVTATVHLVRYGEKLEVQIEVGERPTGLR